MRGWWWHDRARGRQRRPPEVFPISDLQLSKDILLAVLVREHVVQSGLEVAVLVEVDRPADAVVVDVLAGLDRPDCGRQVEVGIRPTRGGRDARDLLDDLRALPRVRRQRSEDADHRPVEVVRVERLAVLGPGLAGEELVERLGCLRTGARSGDRSAGTLERGGRNERRDGGGPASGDEELPTVEPARPEQGRADLRVVRREVEDDVRVGVALDDVVASEL